MTPPGRWGACGTPHELTMIAPLQRGRHHTLEGKRLKRPHFGRSTPYLVASPTSRDLTDRNQPSSGRSLDKRGREHPWVPWDAVCADLRRDCHAGAPQPNPRARDPPAPSARTALSREGCTHKASQRPGADPPSTCYPHRVCLGPHGRLLSSPSHFSAACRHTHRVRSPQPSAQRTALLTGGNW